ncbi:hypertrehalosaemic prohormone-like [Copidosoma floridanum]|uniref:hypertrehalosaemic prohormone-like n=1 Tax=Copidosoma floridanum TaxID=29053 RepID=UPI0006C96C2D|nr:hypertrehalosaemic prohormone-like [Copidosoma floridanum]
MTKTIAYRFTFLVCVLCYLQLAVAQVTFSKGWGPGKRAALYDDDCRVNSKTLTLMFHTLMAELKRLMACDHQATVNYLQSVEH